MATGCLSAGFQHLPLYLKYPIIFPFLLNIYHAVCQTIGRVSHANASLIYVSLPLMLYIPLQTFIVDILRYKVDKSGNCFKT